MNKKLSIYFVFILFAITISAQKTVFCPGQIWPDNNNEHINAHGGGILYNEKNATYYWFGEYKKKNSNSALTGVSCYSSTDLYNWSNKGIALRVSSDSTSEITSGCIIERPKVVYNKKTNKYIMFFHLELKGQGYAAARVGIASSDKVTGPYVYLKSLRPNANCWPINMTQKQKKETTQISDFKDWWTPEWRKAVVNGLFVRRDFAGGQMSRDMTIYVDDNGKAYEIFSSEENLTIQLAELTDDYLSFTGKYIRIAPGDQNEAPTIFKQNHHYYLITSGCTGWAPNAARLYVASHIWGPWVRKPNPAKGNEAELTFRSQGTYILPVHGKKDDFIFMADRWEPKTPSDGRYIWLPIKFEDNLPVLRWMDKWDLSTFDKTNK